MYDSLSSNYRDEHLNVMYPKTKAEATGSDWLMKFEINFAQNVMYFK